MLTREQTAKLGRYEKGTAVINIAVSDDEQDDDKVVVSWGVVGFGYSQNGILSITDAEILINAYVMDGFQKVDELPLSESLFDGGALLDWVGGITR